MKLLLTLFISAFVSVVSSASAETIRLSEPVAQDANSETFGKVIDSSLTQVSMAEVATQSAALVGKPFIVETKIAKVCQKKGCFFIAQYQDQVIRVSFRDYGFFIPTDAGGKTVVLAGELVEKEMSAEQAEHFNQDLKSEAGAIKTGVVYEIIADSVKIPRVS